MILVDSSAWIDFFTKGPLAKKIEREMKGAKAIITLDSDFRKVPEVKLLKRP